jgi:hypothetical protein
MTYEVKYKASKINVTVVVDLQSLTVIRIESSVDTNQEANGEIPRTGNGVQINITS